jgi:single-strand DNA-binding protein
MNETMLTISGNVATDIRFLRSERGTPLASFRLASTPRRYDRTQGGWVDGRTTYVTVVCWRTLAENVAASLHKGEPVVVFGKLRVEPWERDGRTGVAAEVEGTAVGHDLSRGTSAFRRTRREHNEAPSDSQVADDLARSWDASSDGEIPNEPTDVGVAGAEAGALPKRSRSGGRAPLAASAASADADQQAA